MRISDSDGSGSVLVLDLVVDKEERREGIYSMIKLRQRGLKGGGS